MRGKVQLALIGALVTGATLLVAWACETDAARGSASRRSESHAVAVRSARAWGAGSWGPGAMPAATDGGVLEDEETRCIRVRVRDWELTRVPNALVLLGADDEGTRRVVSEVRTDLDGVATTCGPTDRDLEIDAWDDDGRWGRATVYWDFYVGELVLTLTRPTVVSGRLTGPDGQAIAGAELCLGGLFALPDDYCHDHNHRLTGADDWRTDANGAFEIPIAFPGLYQLRARAEGFVDGVAGPIVARMEGDVRLDFALEPSASLSGVVTGDDGPVVGADVWVSTSVGLRSTTTDEAGWFEVRGLSSGDYVSVTLEADGFTLLRRDDLRAGEHRFALQRTATLVVHAHLTADAMTCPPFEDRGLLIVVAEGRREQRAISRDVDSRAEGLTPGDAIAFVQLGMSVVRSRVTLRPGLEERLDLEMGLDASEAVLRVRVVGGPTDEDLEGLPATFARELEDGAREVYLRSPSGCLPVRPAAQEIVSTYGHWIGRAQVTPIAGRVTDVEVRLEPGPVEVEPQEVDPVEPADPVPLECHPQLSLSDGPDGAPTVWFAPPESAPFLPGDRVISVDGVSPTSEPWEALYDALLGAEGSTVHIEAVRPDGRRLSATLERTQC